MNTNKTLFSNQFSKITHRAEQYVIEAIKAFDNKDFDQFWEMIKSLDSMEKRGLISGDWSQKQKKNSLLSNQSKQFPKQRVIITLCRMKLTTSCLMMGSHIRLTNKEV